MCWLVTGHYKFNIFTPQCQAESANIEFLIHSISVSYLQASFVLPLVNSGPLYSRCGRSQTVLEARVLYWKWLGAKCGFLHTTLLVLTRTNGTQNICTLTFVQIYASSITQSKKWKKINWQTKQSHIIWHTLILYEHNIQSNHIYCPPVFVTHIIHLLNNDIQWIHAWNMPVGRRREKTPIEWGQDKGKNRI